MRTDRHAGTNGRQPSNRRGRSPWFILIIVLLLSIAAPMAQFKVPPVIPLLMKSMALSPAMAGLLMSIFALTGIVLAIPSGFIFQRFGFRVSGLVVIISLTLGSALGALSTNFTSLLVSRMIEGVGLCFIIVAAPAIVAASFPTDKLGKAMGIWSVWIPVATTVMFAGAPFIAGVWGWRGVWWAGCLYTLATGALFLGFVRPLSGETLHQAAHGGGEEQSSAPSPALVLRSGRVWLMALLFFCFNFVYISFMSWTPAFLNVARGMPLTKASGLAAIMTLLTIAGCPAAGILSDMTGSRKLVCLIPFLIMAPAMPLAFHAGTGLLIPLIMIIGFVAAFVPTGALAAVPDLVPDPRLSGMAMAIVQIGQNVGMLLGPLTVGSIVGTAGWHAAILALAPVSLLGAFAAWATRMR